MLQMLISVTSCNVNAADNDQTVPLVMAALQGNAVICETLVCNHAVCMSLLHGVAENHLSKWHGIAGGLDRGAVGMVGMGTGYSEAGGLSTLIPLTLTPEKIGPLFLRSRT